MNCDDYSPVDGRSSGMDYKTDRLNGQSSRDRPKCFNSGHSANVPDNGVNAQIIIPAATENERKPMGSLPSQFVKQSSKADSANWTEDVKQIDRDNDTSKYSDFSNQSVNTSNIVDSCHFADSGKQSFRNDYSQESEMLEVNAFQTEFAKGCSEANCISYAESNKPAIQQNIPDNETLKFCTFVKQCTKRSKINDSHKLPENEIQSETKDIRNNNIFPKPPHNGKDNSLCSSESERVSEQNGAENETLKFGTFPKQIKVYKKCQINSLCSPEYKTASLDRGTRPPVKGMRLLSGSCYDDQTGNSTQGRASVRDFYRHSKREIINTTARVEENECLREIIEDLRSTLQRRDAQCLALQVALQHAQVVYNSKRLNEEQYMGREPFVSVIYEEVSEETDPNADSRLSSPNYSGIAPYNYPEDETNASKNSEFIDREHGQPPRFPRPQLIVPNEAGEAELLEHLKEELYRMSRDKAILEDQNKTLVDTLETLNGNYAMTRRMFEVALAKVRDLESEVAVVPYLQERIAQYESQAEVKQRTGKGQVARPKSSTLEGVLGFIRRTRHRSTTEDRDSPVGSSQGSIQSHAESSSTGYNNTLEKDKKQKRLSWRGSRTSSNYNQSETVSQLQETFASLNSRFTKVSEEKRQLFDELQCCKLRNNECRKELENVGTDLVRLTKLQEKLQEIVLLLHVLRRKYLSRRTLGKFLFDVLDECPESSRDDVIAEQFVEGLMKKLSESELFREEPYHRVPSSRRPSHPSSEESQSLTAKERETLCFL